MGTLTASSDDLVPIYTLSVLEAPVAIIAVSIIPIYNLLVRGQRFGMISLFSTRAYRTPLNNTDRPNAQSSSPFSGIGLASRSRSLLNLFQKASGQDLRAKASKSHSANPRTGGHAQRTVWGMDHESNEDATERYESSANEEESMSGTEIPMGRVLVRNKVDVFPERVNSPS